MEISRYCARQSWLIWFQGVVALGRLPAINDLGWAIVQRGQHAVSSKHYMVDNPIRERTIKTAIAVISQKARKSAPVWEICKKER